MARSKAKMMTNRLGVMVAIIQDKKTEKVRRKKRRIGAEDMLVD